MDITIRTPYQLSIYLGPPLGMYSLEGFQRFVEKDVKMWMDRNSIQSEFNLERTNGKITYHFPNAGIGIEYGHDANGRCAVQAFVETRHRSNLVGLFRFITTVEREEKMRVRAD